MQGDRLGSYSLLVIMQSAEHGSVLDDARAEVHALWQKVRGVELRTFGESGPESINEGLLVPLTVLLDRGVTLASSMLARLGAPGEVQETSGSRNFGLALDEVLEQASGTRLPALVALIAAELKRQLIELKAPGPESDPAELLGACGAALYGLRKSLGAVERVFCEANSASPVIPYETELTYSLKVRHQYSKMWRLEREAGAVSPPKARDALRRLGTLLAVLRGSDHLMLRSPDHYRLRLLHQRVVAWASSPPLDESAGVKVWEDFLSFVESLRQVNQRQELVAHDAEALRQAEQLLVEGTDTGVAEAVKLLRSVEGLDRTLDAILAAEAPSEKLLAEVRRVGARFHVDAVPPSPGGVDLSGLAFVNAPAVAMLIGHLSARATGEMIAVGNHLEVHLHLQAGRIAWGTTTAARFVFRNYLSETYKVDEDALREALIDAQRTRRPLGETLVAWGLLTPEQVREGLRAQVVAVLTTLPSCNTSQSIFLPRGAGYAKYEPNLTFDLEELLPLLETELAHG